MTDLRKLIDDVRAAVATYGNTRGDWRSGDWDAARRRERETEQVMKAAVEALGATFGERPPHDHWVRLAGIRSGSTSGFHGALGNWLVAATKRLRGGEPMHETVRRS